MGVDAAAFVQAQTMNDVRELAEGQWQWNGWLNAKGRVIALFALARLDAARFVAILPDFPAAELLPLLQRFVFRAKVRLRVVDEFIAAAATAPEAHVLEDVARVGGNLDTGFSFDFGGEVERRTLLLAPAASEFLQPPASSVDDFWIRQDIAHGLPRLDNSQREAWTPQMLSLERLHAFSLKKGCYPGQEIVARTHYLGRARRGLSRVVGADLAVGQALTDESGAALGTIICANLDRTEALAVIATEPRASQARLGDQTIALPDFLGGLQRPM